MPAFSKAFDMQLSCNPLIVSKTNCANLVAVSKTNCANLGVVSEQIVSV